MSVLATENRDVVNFEAALIQGDLKELTPAQRISYYRQVCESVGLNPLTKPFSYLSLSGKTVLYANRDCTDQLRKNNCVSIRIDGRETIDGVHIVTAAATDKTGRVDVSTGAVNVKGLQGEALANAYMKAETKAKRRVTLSICGLGMLDETEVQTIREAVVLDDEGNQPKSPTPAALPPKESTSAKVKDTIIATINACATIAELDTAKKAFAANFGKLNAEDKKVVVEAGTLRRDILAKESAIRADHGPGSTEPESDEPK